MGKKMKKMRKKILIWLVVTTIILDITATLYNMSTRPVINEINPLYIITKQHWFPITVNIIVCWLCYRQMKKYDSTPLFWRYMITSLCSILILIHGYGTYSNVHAMLIIPAQDTLTASQTIKVQQQYQASDKDLLDIGRAFICFVWGYIISIILLFKVWEWIEKDGNSLYKPSGG